MNRGSDRPSPLTVQAAESMIHMAPMGEMRRVPALVGRAK